MRKFFKPVTLATKKIVQVLAGQKPEMFIEKVVHTYNALKKITIIVYMIPKMHHKDCTGWHQKKPMYTHFNTTTFIITYSQHH
jgi:hypothetical protein